MPFIALPPLGWKAHSNDVLEGPSSQRKLKPWPSFLPSRSRPIKRSAGPGKLTVPVPVPLAELLLGAVARLRPVDAEVAAGIELGGKPAVKGAESQTGGRLVFECGS